MIWKIKSYLKTRLCKIRFKFYKIMKLCFLFYLIQFLVLFLDFLVKKMLNFELFAKLNLD